MHRGARLSSLEPARLALRRLENQQLVSPSLASGADVVRGMALLAEGKPTEALAELRRSDGYANAFAQLAMIDAYTASKDQKSADAARAELLGRKDISNGAVSKAIARYRATKKH